MIEEINVETYYTGLGGNPVMNVIQKTMPLLTLSKSRFTLLEFKLIDTYLSRINSKNRDMDVVVIRKKELENIFGISRLRKDEIEKSLDRLCKRIRVEDLKTNEIFLDITLFDIATYQKDEKGLPIIILRCSKAAKQFIFNIDEIGYFKYHLKNILKLKSKYSYWLYLYVERNAFRKKWSIDIDSLKKEIGCKDGTYQDFKMFNHYVVKVPQNEIEKNTNCKFNVEKIKIGKNVTGFQFEIMNSAEKELFQKKKNEELKSEKQTVKEIKNEEVQNVKVNKKVEPVYDPKINEIINYYSEKKGLPSLSTDNMQKIIDLIDEFPKLWIKKAIDISAEKNAGSIKYVEMILKNWQEGGLNNTQNSKEKELKDKKNKSLLLKKLTDDPRLSDYKREILLFEGIFKDMIDENKFEEFMYDEILNIDDSEIREYMHEKLWRDGWGW